MGGIDHAAGALAGAGVMLRSLQALQSLAKVDTIIFDKTGTLTNEDFSLKKISTRSDVSEAQVLALAAALAQHSFHPVSRALVRSQKSLENKYFNYYRISS